MNIISEQLILRDRKNRAEMNEITQHFLLNKVILKNFNKNKYCWRMLSCTELLYVTEFYKTWKFTFLHVKKQRNNKKNPSLKDSQKILLSQTILSKEKIIKTPHILPMSQWAGWKPNVLWIKLSVLQTVRKLIRCTQIKGKESQGAQSEAAQVHVCNSTFRAWQGEKTILYLH